MCLSVDGLVEAWARSGGHVGERVAEGGSFVASSDLIVTEGVFEASVGELLTSGKETRRFICSRQKVKGRFRGGGSAGTRFGMTKLE